MPVCELLQSSLPTLLGAVIGGGASIVATILVNRQNGRLSRDARIEARNAKRRGFVFDNYTGLQTAMLDYARKTAQAWTCIRKHYDGGAEWREAMLPDELSEGLLAAGQEVLLHESRIPDDALRAKVGDLRKLESRVTLEARTTEELERAMKSFMSLYDMPAGDVDEKVRAHLREED